MELRCYGKGEMAMEYFPNLPVTLAMRKLRRWIHVNPELERKLAECHVSKNADFYSKIQVRLIFDYLDEP